MDWAKGTYDAPSAMRIDPAAPRLLEMFWRVMGPSLKELCCGLYRTEAGLELRCGYGIDDLLRSQRVDDAFKARYLAAGWIAVVLAKGSFTVLESTVDDELAEIRSH